jgi:hypothetical protein
VFNGDGVALVIVDEGGWVLQLEGDPGVRRRRSIEGKSSSEGCSPEGAPTVTLGRSSARRRGSGGRKPTRKMPGRWGRMRGAQAWMDETNGARGERNFWPVGGNSVLTGSGGVGAGGVDVAWRRSGRERAGGGGAGAAWSSAAAARPQRTWRTAGST